MRRLLILLFSVALLVAGCGGGGSSNGSSGKSATPSGPPLTKAAYTAKVEEFAKQIGNKLGTTTSDIDKITKKELDAGVEAIRSFADELATVNPPAAIKDLHTRFVAAIRDLGDELPGLIQKLKNLKNDPSGAFRALLGTKAFKELAKLQQEFKARGYTLKLSG